MSPIFNLSQVAASIPGARVEVLRTILVERCAMKEPGWSYRRSGRAFLFDAETQAKLVAAFKARHATFVKSRAAGRVG